MSYVVVVRRVIGMPEVLALVAADPSLRVTRQDADTLELAWTDDDDELPFAFVQGELEATSPSDAAWRKLESIAGALGAQVIGEEDLIPSRSYPIPQGVFAGRTTWLGWPAMVIVLAVLLAWRW